MRNRSPLQFRQLKALQIILDNKIHIKGSSSLPYLLVDIPLLLSTFCEKCRNRKIEIKRTTLSGSVVSQLLGVIDHTLYYQDVHVTFYVKEKNVPKCTDMVLSSLYDLCPRFVKTFQVDKHDIMHHYIHDIDANDQPNDFWVAVSFNTKSGNVFKVQFATELKRPYNFSLDSFEIDLDNYLRFQKVYGGNISLTFFPTVYISSFYGSVEISYLHLKQRYIVSHDPEQLPGLSLLKLCHLISKGYRMIHVDGTREIYLYLCSRFFIDFNDTGYQKVMIDKYAHTHFNNHTVCIHNFFRILLMIILTFAREMHFTNDLSESIEMLRNYVDRTKDKLFPQRKTLIPNGTVIRTVNSSDMYNSMFCTGQRVRSSTATRFLDESILCVDNISYTV